MAESAFRLPSQLNITDGNISENFRKWKRQVEIYMAATGSDAKEKKATQVAILLYCAGPQVIEIYDQFKWDSPDDKDDVSKVLDKLKQYCNPRTNEVIESHRFWSMEWQEPFDLFLTELRNRADQCNFGEAKDRLIRDKIIFMSQGKLLEQLLKETDILTLEKTVSICQAFEQSASHVKEFRDSSSQNKLAAPSKIQKVRKALPKTKTDSLKQNGDHRARHDKSTCAPKFVNDCDFCGGKHEKSKFKCPAYGKTCDKCNGRNHFKKKCRKIHSVATDNSQPDTEDDYHWLSAINSGPKHEVSAIMKVNDIDVKFQLDSAADVNTICQKFVHRYQVQPTDIKLKMWNNSSMKPLGEVNLGVRNDRTGETTDVHFVVVPNGYNCLLGLNTIQQMGLVTINKELFVNNVNASCLGDLGEASLQVDPEIQPKTLPCRKIPLAIRDDVKCELDNLVQRGILKPVTEPTRWVSQMAVVRKINGRLRLCIDPQALNSALMREHFRLPTLDDVLPELANAKIFSKLDVKEAYWHVRLDEASSLLTTMITPFGRFRWIRLPFGLKVSSEIFQRKLHEAIGDLNGVFSIADDILVAGCGQTDADAKRDNERKLNTLYKRCAERHILLNDDKREVFLKEITFHGHRITCDGVKLDDKKLRAILDMEAPENVSAVKRFCGVVQYMAKFLPDLSSMLEPIRALTRKSVAWNWSTECNEAFNAIKQKLVTAPVLTYFNASKPVTVQVDSSQFGLGAVLLQDDKPVEYASRRLTPAERNWAQIEKEALAILFGLERFDQYTYGRTVIVENDHKPLASILKKPLSSVPRRLQDILVRLGRYDFDFQFIKGTNLVLADALSRAGLGSEHEDRPRIMAVSAYTEITDARLDEIKAATNVDCDMQDLILVIQSGWPDQRSSVPHSIQQYFDFRDTLSYYDGLVVKGEAVVIPVSLRQDMTSRLHKSHLAYDSMLRRARGVIFWPNMSKDIKRMDETCEICQATKPSNARETLHQHVEGAPWQKIGADLFEIQGRHYLVSIDYISNFIEVDYLSSMKSSAVIDVFKKQFSRLGIPCILVSDGGPQFSSQEFKNFTKDWRINHVMSSPIHPQSNGKAEAAVKIMKQMLVKCVQDHSDQYEALMEQRITPRQDTGLSPAEMLFGRSTRTLIPNLKLKTQRVHRNVKRKRRNRRDTVKRSYDRRARNLSKLQSGQSIYFQKKVNDAWQPGKVVDEIKNRSYQVQSADGAFYRRNRVHIRPTNVNVHIRDVTPPRAKIPAVPSHCETNMRPNKPVEAIPETTFAPDIESKLSHASEALTVNSRPKREIKEPVYLKDYVRY
uniref:Uncharacterized protein K02A2.6-like n=1 Tax=Crassostrea virginica TaxID=6565 RepID=A0A8B8CGV7_CRAVI|nr:uncharacterized protein K02A2.6-like [Crassostrea virginica]